MKKIFIITILVVNSLFAQSYIFESKEEKVNIIELYTSQGCSSCPPADKWLSKLKTHDKLFKEFIPMAFHVTYWDFIGWKDVFATKQNDSRQRYYANRIWKNKSVYTPQFVIDGSEYRRWFSNQSFPKFEKNYGGDLKAELSDENKLEVSYFNKNIKDEKVYVNVAILGFDYDIDIKRGENKYKTLEHDFVVLEHIQKFSRIKGNRLSLKVSLPSFKEKGKRYALAVWVNSYNTNILQATAGFLE